MSISSLQRACIALIIYKIIYLCRKVNNLDDKKFNLSLRMEKIKTLYRMIPDFCNKLKESYQIEQFLLIR